MESESSDELDSGYGDRYNFIFFAILCVEDYLATVKGFDPTVGNGYFVAIGAICATESFRINILG